jgi:hypothetical protein
MRNTDIKVYITYKNNEHKSLQELFAKASLTKENVVYQKFSYSATALLGKIKKVESQLKGAINIVEKVGSKEWNTLNLAYLENLAKEEFSYHLAIDSKYYKILCEKLIEKVSTSLLNGEDLAINLRRLSNLKDKLLFNIKRYSDLDYKEIWIRDRYFEVASFIEFESAMGVKVHGSDSGNSIFDIVISGEKTIEDMKRGGIFYDVIANDFIKIRDMAAKDILYELNSDTSFEYGTTYQ